MALVFLPWLFRVMVKLPGLVLVLTSYSLACSTTSGPPSTFHLIVKHACVLSCEDLIISMVAHRSQNSNPRFLRLRAQSSLAWLSGYSTIWLFRYLITPLSGYSIFRLFHYYTIPLFPWTAVPLSRYPLFRCSAIPLFRCSAVPLCLLMFEKLTFLYRFFLLASFSREVTRFSRILSFSFKLIRLSRL